MNSSRWSFVLLILAALLWACSKEHKKVTGPDGSVSVSPSDQDFGNVPIDSCSERTFTIKNVSSKAKIGIVTTLAPFTIASGDSFNLRPGDSVRLVVRFCPKDTVSYVSDIVIDGDKRIVVRARGKGIPQTEREEVIYVDPDVPPGGSGSFDKPLNSIQVAVDRAALGAHIILAPKKFTEPIKLTHRVSLRGTSNGLDTTTLVPSPGGGLGKNGQTPGVAVDIDSASGWSRGDTLLDNILIAAGSGGSTWDVGVRIQELSGTSASVTISKVDIRGCSDAAIKVVGSGIRFSMSDCHVSLNKGQFLRTCEITAASATLNSCTFTSNITTSPFPMGAQFNIGCSESYSLNNCAFVKCKASPVLGLFGQGVVRSTTIRSCTPDSVADLFQDLIWIRGGRNMRVDFEDVNVLSNDMPMLNLERADDAPITIQFTRSRFIGNLSKPDKLHLGLITNVDKQVQLLFSDCDLIGNCLESVSAGFPMFQGAGPLILDNCVVAANGALMDFRGSEHQFRNCTFALNMTRVDTLGAGRKSLQTPNIAPAGMTSFLASLHNCIVAFNTWGLLGDLWQRNCGCNDVYMNGFLESEAWFRTDYFGNCTPSSTLCDFMVSPSDMARCTCDPCPSDVGTDPQFRNVGQLDFGLKPESPLLNGSCGRIGASR